MALREVDVRVTVTYTVRVVADSGIDAERQAKEMILFDSNLQADDIDAVILRCFIS